ITTGVGRSAMSFFRKVKPSMRGISTSITMTSGHCRFMRCMAKSGSAAAPITVMSGSLSSKAVMTCRTTAESSTMSTLMLVRISIAPLAHRSPVNRWSDGFQALHDPVEAFGMTDDQIPAWAQGSHDAAHDFSFGFLTEVDEYVSQKDEVEINACRP